MDAAANLQPTPPGDGLSQARDLLLLASEELRGPLTSVSGYLQVLLDGEVGGLDPGQERVAEIAARNAGRMERLLDSLIVVSHLQAGTGEVRAIPMADLVRRTVDRLGPRASNRGIHLGLGVGTDELVMADPLAVEQAVESMIDHAMTFSSGGGTVDVIVREELDEIVVDVHDDGVPLESEHLHQVFAGRFASAVAGPRVLLGSRLELFMVRLVAEAHGGSVAADITSDGRSHLMMRLPRVATA
ncbi:MAG: HAMP domain-containing sensor histidine kinase [Thermoleophilia bacterium]